MNLIITKKKKSIIIISNFNLIFLNNFKHFNQIKYILGISSIKLKKITSKWKLFE